MSEFNSYSGQKKLRFWCQKVLPLIYDDSLSYYELLNKIVVYLNNTISDVDACEANITELIKEFNDLKDYVETQIEALKPIVEDVIDDMVESGEFGQLLADALEGLIATDYNTVDEYSPLDYVLHDGYLYRCTDYTSGSWDSTKWTQTIVCNELNYIRKFLASLNAGQVAYFDAAVYDDNSVGKEIQNLKNGAANTRFVYIDTMATNTISALITALNGAASSIPNGSSIVRVGNSSNGGRCTLLVNKVNNNTASAYVTSQFGTLNNALLVCESGVWKKTDYGYNILDGKTIYIFGDSLSDETSAATESLQPNWVTHLRSLLPRTTIKNRAIAGYKISGATGSVWYKINAEDDMSDADFVIIWAGVNDYRHGVELGEFFNVTLTNTTFCGSLNLIRNMLFQKAPNAQYIFITPPKNRENNLPEDNSIYRPLVMYRAAIATFCANNGFTMIDGYNLPMINPSNQTLRQKYQSDGTHFLPSYALMEANQILNKILSGGDTELVRELVRINIGDLVASGVTNNYAYADFSSDGKVRLTCDGSFSGTEDTDKSLITVTNELKSLTTTIVVCQQRYQNNPYEAGYALISTTGTISTRAMHTDTISFRFGVEYSTKFAGYNIYPM